jgi:hypothetical protein
MRNTTYMPRTVNGPSEADVFTVIYDFAPTGYRLDRGGRLSKPTGAAATGTWTAYRVLSDGKLEAIPGKGILKQDIEETIETVLAQAA